jgi:outer membrane immunogenic protein
MTKSAYKLFGAILGLTSPALVCAQELDSDIETTVGLSAGIVDIGSDNRSLGVEQIERTGAVYGVFVSADKSLTSKLFVGMEANANVGTGPVNYDMGASVRFGYQAEGTKAYVRAGYQWLSVDFGDPANAPFGGEGSSRGLGDYLVGAGIDIPIFKKVVARVNFDTIGFEALRATSGVGLRF